MSLSTQPNFTGRLCMNGIKINTNLEQKLSKDLSKMPYDIHVEQEHAPYREMSAFKIKVAHNNGDEVIINKPSTTFIGGELENILKLLQLGK